MSINFLNNKKGQPILRWLLIPMSILVVLEILLLVGSIFLGGVTANLDQNAKDILQEKVLNRKNYLQNEMVGNWSNVKHTTMAINEKAEALIKANKLDIHAIDEDPDNCAPLLRRISGDLITMMRSNRVSGAYVIFNTSDLDKSPAKKKPGIYFRDLDPVSNPSATNEDLLLERAPISLVHRLGIPTNSWWRPQFNFTKKGYKSYPFFYKTFQNAYKSSPDIDISDLGYWSKPFSLNSNSSESKIITYSVPLRLSDGTVYGVLGLDLTMDYLQKTLPYNEISESKQGAYLLSIENGKPFQFTDLLVNGPVYTQATTNSSKLRITHKTDSSYILETGDNDSKFYCSVQYLDIYNSNTAFASDRWALIGAVKTSDLLASSHEVMYTLIIAITCTLILGILGSIFISLTISRPMARLSRDIMTTNPKKTVKLRRTNIHEVDQLTASIEFLSNNVIESNHKFAQILELASVKLGGFDIASSTGTLFVTDHFFDIFNIPDVNTDTLEIDEFKRLLQTIVPYEYQNLQNGVTVYKIPDESGFSYTQLKYIKFGEHHIGLAEDVTRTVMEKTLIEHERDHDLLTGLINRRAFHRKMQKLFGGDTDLLKISAMVMIDLDNLKYINDTYGHDCGDKYIKSSAEAFLSGTPEGTIVSRISGDEFYLFFYGYDRKEDIKTALDTLREEIDHKEFILPTFQKSKIKVTGGVSWYPEDSSAYEDLLRYSDFAMYKTKRSAKGQFSDFDIGAYNKEAYILQSKQELKELLDNQLVEYHFQPIVRVFDGQIFAYEALMRANMPTLHTPYDILSLAREEGKLAQVEYVTYFNAIDAFVSHKLTGLLTKSCKLFFNSLPNQILDLKSIKQLEEKYGDYLSSVVVEITEEEQLVQDLQNYKMNYIRNWNCELALDDYGSGYNSEKALLELSPNYVKVDMNIIRSIDKDSNKQEIVRHIISYGHERNMFIIAEGIETLDEARVVIKLGADYLQGYYLAKPALIPPTIHSATVDSIVELYNQYHNET